MYSTDGATWTDSGLPNDGGYVGIAWDATLALFVAVGATNPIAEKVVLTSADGISWTERTSPDNETVAGTRDQRWYAITSAGGLLVAVGYDLYGSENVMTSADGITWVLRDSGITNTIWKSVKWNGTVFVAVGSSANINEQVMTSPDGINWTARAASISRDWQDVAWNGTVWAAVSQGGSSTTPVMTSPDGITWTTRTVPTAGSFHGITYDGSLFIAVSRSNASANQSITSADGITWSDLAGALPDTGQQWQGITNDGTRTVAVSLTVTGNLAMTLN